MRDAVCRIYRVSRNPLLAETMGLYWNHLRRAMAEVLKYPARRRSIWDEHAGIQKVTIPKSCRTPAAGSSCSTT